MALPAGVVDACTTFTPVLYDRLNDTTQTLAQVQHFDAQWAALCPGQAAAIKKAVKQGKAIQ